jgi:hypothetical protein
MVFRLPTIDYDAFITLLEAIRICLQPSVSDDDIARVQTTMKRFLDYYELRYYARQYDRLPACLPVFHQLAHVADFLNILGPMWVYSQWVMERVCGMMVVSARNRFTANRNLQINLLLQEQRHLIPYLSLQLAEDESRPGSSGATDDSWLDDLHHRLSSPVDAIEAELHCQYFEDESNRALLDLYLQLLHSQTAVMQRSAPGPPAAALLTLHPPSHTIGFDGALTRALRSCLGNQYVGHPRTFTRWSGCCFPASALKRPFTVIGAKTRASNSTRSSSYVRVAVHDCTHFYGDVQFFFTVTMEGATHQLAYIQQWKTLSDDHLVYKASQGHVLCVVHCSDIVELVGLVKRGDRMYIVREMGLPVDH